MGRPLGKKFFGDPSNAGNQLNVEAWIPGGSGAVAAWVVAQKSNTTYEVTDGTDTGRCKLQEEAITGPGQMRIAVMPFGIDAATAEARMSAVGGTVASGGTGYLPGETLTVSGGTSATAATFDVTNVAAVSATVAMGGSGYTVGDTVTLVGATGTAATFTVASETGGSVDTVTLASGGDMTAVPSNPAATTNTGTGDDNLTLTVTYEALSGSVVDAGDYTALPTNPVATSGGSGTGATLTMDWGVLAIDVTAGGAGYVAAPTVTITGSATGTAVLSGDAVGSVTVDAAGSGYTAVAGVTIDSPSGDSEYAKILNRHHVKTFSDVVYKWNKDKTASAKGEADLDFS